MIAYRPSPRPSIKEQFAVFKAHMETIAPPEVREPISCPECGRALGSFIGRRTGRNIVLHFECGGRCRRQFVAGYGDTPAEALRAFEENSWQRSGHPTIDAPGEDLQLLPVSGAFSSESHELDKENEAAVSDDFEEVNKLLTLPEKES